MPEETMERELFGFERGAFTGANSSKKGLLEEADGGTMFLDDISAMDIKTQAKLLRVIEYGELRRVGGNKTRRVDVRFIVATNRNLRKMVEEGTFRNDLYFRVNILNLLIPPFAIEQVIFLCCTNTILKSTVRLFLNKFHHIFLSAFSPAFAYTYPGNVRELVSIVERFCTLFEPEYAKDENYLRALVCGCIGTEVYLFRRKNNVLLRLAVIIWLMSIVRR